MSDNRRVMALIPFGALDRPRLLAFADWLVVGVAFSLPWSTSATSILIGLWLIAFLPAVDVASLRDEVRTASGGLPVVLFLLGVLGMTWSSAALTERLAGSESFLRLIAIPLLLLQFRNSTRGHYVLVAFLAACSLLLVSSYAVTVWPDFWPGHMHGRTYGVPVKNYIAQSAEFTVCAFALLYLAGAAWKEGDRLRTLLLVLGSSAFLFNIFFVATSRTTIVILPVIFLIWATYQFGVRGVAVAFFVAVIAGSTIWSLSPYLRDRFADLMVTQTQVQRIDAVIPGTVTIPTSTGERLEFWRKSIRFIADAPLIGHGTGSIRDLFVGSVNNTSPAAAEISTNPHNQTFTVAIQLGLIGAALLWAMWAAHLMLFRSDGVLGWLGFLIVIENIGGSIFNSFLFDFTEGWLYVFGVGVLGGAARRRALSHTRA